MIIPAAHWPALRRLVRVRRAVQVIYAALGFLVRLAVLWFCLVGVMYVLRHPAPVEPATLITAFGAAIGLFFEVRERVTRPCRRGPVPEPDDWRIER